MTNGNRKFNARLVILIVWAVIALLLIYNELRISWMVPEVEPPEGRVLYRFRIWFAAIGTLAIFSFLLKENRLSRGFEHAFLGCATGMGTVITITDVLYTKWWVPMSGSFQDLFANGPSGSAIAGIALVLPGIVGMMWYFQYSRKYFWISRIALCVTLGAGAALGFKRLFNEMLPQIKGTFKPLWPGQTILRDATFWDRAGIGFENTVFVLGTITVLIYFFFAFGRRNWSVRGSARLGRWYLMLALGVFFGNTFLTRISALIDRVHFLVAEWLRLKGI